MELEFFLRHIVPGENGWGSKIKILVDEGLEQEDKVLVEPLPSWRNCMVSSFSLSRRYLVSKPKGPKSLLRSVASLGWNIIVFLF